MKKKYVVILLVIMFGLGIGVEKLLHSNDNIDDGFNDLSQVKHENMLSMMLEQNAGAGDYSLETRSSWPTQEEGYVFNSTLSKCEKGSKLRWDDENNVVVMEGTNSDKCYVYFDVYVETDVSLASWVKSQYTGTQGANNLYYHDSSLTNGAGDNSYRYAGSSDTTNNFVCFGSDASTCPDDSLYRIIGVFGDQVKLIKWDYANMDLLGTDGDFYAGGTRLASDISSYKGSKSTIHSYFWNSDVTNTWSASELNTVNLNTNFINNIGSTWASKIAETTWKVGGNTYDNIVNVTASNAYKNEYTSPAEGTTYKDKIALMYTSDYGFAASPNAWTTNLKSYDSYINENWMYMGISEWTVVRCLDSSIHVFNVYKSCYYNTVGYGESVRPVFHLNSDITYVSGSGSKSSPIRIN